MHRFAVLLVPAVLVVMLLGVACGDDDDDADADAADAEAAVAAMVEAWNARDIDAFRARFTDAGLLSFWEAEGAPIDDVVAELAAFIGDPPISGVEYRETTVDGDTATVEVQVVFGMALDAERLTLVRQDEAWLIDRDDDVAVQIPDGTETVEAETYEFAFNIDTDALAAADDPVAIAVDNIGSQPHELAIARIAEDADIEELLASEAPEIELVGVAGPLESGATTNLVLTQALEPGRYVIVCFLPDTSEGPEGTPHVFKGMLAEFTKS